MTLQAGTRFGPYEVLEQIGSGGMGQVWRAHDTKLKRDVAVKVLPASFAADADRVSRFRREAEILAALNHPNIATIFGLEQTDGQTVIVMELIEGPTLADRIADGPILPEEAMRIALQVATALEAAHSKQIVHRDLKPANVKLRDDGTVKVLDFGISRPIDASAISGGTPVMTTPAVTETGVILGTAAYMSPEQARGLFVDERTDIWAFGCLLFEMLTGQPAFAGEDVMATLARVIDRATDLSSMPGTISPAVRHTIELCLEKNPQKRIADIRDVRLALEGAFERWPDEAALPGTARAPRSRLPIAAAAVVAALVVGGAAWMLKPEPLPEPGIVMRFDHELPDGVTLRNPVTGVLDLAPNGEFFVYNGSDGIHIRQMAETEDRSIPGTGGTVVDPVVSPNSREVVYFRVEQGVELARIAVNGGAPIVLASELTAPFGISWESDGTILFGQIDGIWRVSENGGTPERIIESEAGEQVFGPQLLPGGEWVLFTLARTGGSTRWSTAEIVIESLATGERRVLRSGATDARYLPTGHLTYVFENVLFASTFDVATLTLDDERVSLVQGVATSFSAEFGGSGFYATSDSGTLIYIPGMAGPSAESPERSLVWVDRRGNTERLPLRADDYTMARISPDGTKVAVTIGSAQPPTEPAAEIYIFDLQTENLAQLTFDPEHDDWPVWSPDGTRIYFRSSRDGPGVGTYAVPANGGTPEPLFTPGGQGNLAPWGISADGTALLGTVAEGPTDVDLAMIEIENSDEIIPLIDDDGISVEPSFSPNGEWIAYYNATGPGQNLEVNIRPYPDVTQQRRPIASGLNPVFSADGSELFFMDGAGLSSVAVEYSPFRVGSPEALFRGQYWYGVAGPNGSFGRAWDVDPSGERFLMISMPGGGAAGDDAPSVPKISIVLNWFEELRRRVPVE